MVDINTVYQRVLLLANKEQRGYITPEEFNSFAEQAQLEILDGYFAKRIAVDGIPGGDDEYSDAMSIVEERLKIFNEVEDVTKTGDEYLFPRYENEDGTTTLKYGNWVSSKL